MLLGNFPDAMYQEPELQGWNPDIAERKNMTWAYPPVLLLKADQDWDVDKERIADSMKILQRQVRRARSSPLLSSYMCC